MQLRHSGRLGANPARVLVLQATCKSIGSYVVVTLRIGGTPVAPAEAGDSAASRCQPDACVVRRDGVESTVDRGDSLHTADAEALEGNLWGMAPVVGTN